MTVTNHTLLKNHHQGEIDENKPVKIISLYRKRQNQQSVPETHLI